MNSSGGVIIGTVTTEGAGTLVLAATPIGQVGDAPPRLAEELASADVVAAEDTRRLRRLTSELGITLGGRVVSYFEGNESARTPVLLEALLAGQRVVLVTDAGMPSVSDPGYRLVAAAVEAGVRVTAVPGPSAVLTALAVSGLPVDRFCFEGFLPRKQGERARRLDGAGRRGAHDGLLRGAAPHGRGSGARWPQAWGERSGGRGLPRADQDPRGDPPRARSAELVDWAAEGVRGEVTIVVTGAPGGPSIENDEESLRAAVARREEAGMSRKDAIVEVAKLAGVPKREVYNLVHGA